MTVDGAGGAEWVGGMDLPTRSGREVRVRAGVDEVVGRFVPWSHLPGGRVLLPPLADEVERLVFELDGVRYEVER